MGVNSLPKTVTRQYRGCDLNPGPFVPESSTLTTQLRSHPTSGYTAETVQDNKELTYFTWVTSEQCHTNQTNQSASYFTCVMSDWSASRPISSFVAVYFTILSCWLVSVSTTIMSVTGISNDPDTSTRLTFNSCSNFSFISNLSVRNNPASQNHY